MNRQYISTWPVSFALAAQLSLPLLRMSFIVWFVNNLYALTYTTAALKNLSSSLWEAGLVHHLPKWRVAQRIVLPLLFPSVLAGWITVFSIGVRDLVAPMLVSPPGLQTVSAYIFQQFDQGDLSSGMAMAITVVLLTLLLHFFVQRLQTRGGR